VRPLVLVVLLAACGEPAPFFVPDAGPPPDPCAALSVDTGVECEGDTAHRCEGGATVETEDCAATGRSCFTGRGCALCLPGTLTCDGETLLSCDADGEGRSARETCDASAGLRCSAAGCVDLCAEAEASRAYIGCEYWPTPALNSQVPSEFDFAIVVANPQLVPARITVERAGVEQASTTVAPGALETIRLPWVTDLKGTFGQERSGVVAGGAYRVRSDVPVSVYQFNPLDYRIDEDCEGETGSSASDGRCYSFSNDASLLLPTHALTGSYLAQARPSMLLIVPAETGAERLTSPGYVAITAVEDGTEVEVLSRANLLGSADGLIPNLSPGETTRVTLNQGDVLQLLSGAPADCPGAWEDEPNATGIRYCELGSEWDLTGSEIRASAPVAVVGGHNCSFVPFNRWACDHLEEALFPVESWGRELLLGSTHPLRSEPNLIRVVSAADGNVVSFDPPLHEELTLDRGQSYEMQLSGEVRVRGSQPLSIAQFLVGQDFAGLGSSGSFGSGDPSMSLAIPTEQFRMDYTLLAPETYDESWVNVTAPLAARVTIDGRTITNFTPIGTTGAGVARVPASAGVHRLEGTAPFGVVVYGFGRYTSYMYPGGLDLREIAPPI